MRVLVTGTAGFIGNHVALRLLERGDEVVGIDNLNPYYSVELKQARLNRLHAFGGFVDKRISLEDKAAMDEVFRQHQPQRVINLAAQAGVRHSLSHPQDYLDSNITGFLNLLEGARHFGCEHFVYASSSSVYGANAKMPFSVGDRVDHPMSVYAASKRCNELMAHCYSHLFGIPSTGLRFFSVYGPWGRPDMALFLFAEAIVAGRPINVFNHGKMRRDFTYIDDIVSGVIGVLDHIPSADPDWTPMDPQPQTSGIAPFRVYNIGNNKCVELKRYIELLEDALGRKAIYNMMPIQPGDVPASWADIDDISADIGYSPTTDVETGIRNFVNWYVDFYGVK